MRKKAERFDRGRCGFAGGGLIFLVIRGEKVMLDFDLAKIYGYETKYLNWQVMRNAKKFEGDDFMFRLTEDEAMSNLRCQIGTSSWGGTR